MKSLRKIGSKFNIRRKEKPIEVSDWPLYDPLAYETYNKPLKQVSSSRDEGMSRYAGAVSQTMFGASREMFEWDEPGEYDEDVNDWTKSDGRADSGDDSVLRSVYGATGLPLFGPQYGMSQLSRIDAPEARNPLVMRMETSPSYENVMRNADADFERAYLESLESAKDHQTQANPPAVRTPLSPPMPPSPPPQRPRMSPLPTPRRSVKEQPAPAPAPAPSIEPFIPSTSGPTSCIICTEDFSETVRPPGWISLACLHEPSVCSGCLARCMKNDLESKIWNQIKCPECKTLLIYEDVKRLADPETFTRYEVMSFRSAVGGDSNFVWCRGCDFGQLHESGASQPIIRCLNCGFRSCFVHQTPWHERLTCEEYDEMLRDPDGFESSRDQEGEASYAAREMQDEENERLARQLSQRDKRVEQDRQRQRHAEERRRAKAEQEAEAARKELEQERARMKAELKRKVKEEKLSLAKVQETTKPCPGCQWPIEKNEGCDHMTYMSSAGVAWPIGELMAIGRAVSRSQYFDIQALSCFLVKAAEAVFPLLFDASY